MHSTPSFSDKAARDGSVPKLAHSLSIILPAHNEEQVIATTVTYILETLSPWADEFEVVVVDDGSRDRTGEILQALAEQDQRVRVITHPVNQGYGAALVSGFKAAGKELTFFMDSDGQFDIREISLFFPFIDQYDAVLGYRIDRQDTWMRKLNAWGWKQLIGVVLGVHVCDVDCAFKLYRTAFIHQSQFETRGAMINAEMLYKLKRAGYTFTEIGVHHLPRRTGQATGAHSRVILRAFKELFYYARQWRLQEKEGAGSV
ncbi:glycosyltransferase family 2 protein [Dictyobacter halimunensis]